MKKIIICPVCDSKFIKKTKNRLICDSCNKIFSEKTAKYRFLLDNDFVILYDNTNNIIKNKIFDLIFDKLKMKILNRKDKDDNLKKWLNVYYIDYSNLSFEITIENFYKYLKGENLCPICGNKTKFVGIWKRSAYNKYCSDECRYKSISIRQTDDNSVNRIKDKQKWKKNISNSMKDKIKNGEFIPNITNSWSNSKCICKIGEYDVVFRSTWEAFFNLVNPHLKYEITIIPYVFNSVEHNYIVDFTDIDNKILYEIKPDSERNKKLNVVKEIYSLEWCIENNYKYIIIGNDWFKDNFNKYKYLLSDSDKIFKNLKQFE